LLLNNNHKKRKKEKTLKIVKVSESEYSELIEKCEVLNDDIVSDTVIEEEGEHESSVIRRL
jgi:hypothetical protein